jgi:hypothetical protein
MGRPVAGRLRPNVAFAAVEQAGAGAEQDASEVDAHLVDVASTQHHLGRSR